MLDQEASPESFAKYRFRPEIYEQDPILALMHQLQLIRAGRLPDADQRRAVVASALEKLPPRYTEDLMQATRGYAESGEYYYFAGKRYAPVPSGLTIGGTSVVLQLALQLAACDLGMDCTAEHPALALGCIAAIESCDIGNVQQALWRNFDAYGYDDAEDAKREVLVLKEQFVRAIESRDVSAFVEP